MTDASLMDAECIHGNIWWNCEECFSDYPGPGYPGPEDEGAMD